MSERLAVSIEIGGRLKSALVPELLETIRHANVSLDWGDAWFEPRTEAELHTAIREGVLWLCDDQTPDGEIPALEAACRHLGLAYTRRSEGGMECDPEVVDWRPGMAKPLVRIGSHVGHRIHVPTAVVARALKHLQAGRLALATKLLQRLCPRVPELPRFKIV